MSNQVNEANEATVENFFGIFNKKAEDVKLTNNDGKGPSIYFNPDSLNAPDKTYNARIRFLPNINNPDVSLSTKMTYAFPTLTGSRFFYQSPKSLDFYAPCLVAGKYFEFRNSLDPRVKSFGSQIRWSNRTFALIQVIEDYVKPENNGKIFVWDLPSEIEKIIEAQLRPSKQALRDGTVANNVFDPEEGFVMSLDIPIESYTAADGKVKDKRIYTKCKFLPNINPTLIVEGTTQVSKEEAKADSEFQQKIVKMLVANNLLKEIQYVPETEERTQEALAILDQHLTGQIAPSQTTQTQQPVQAPVAQPAQTQAQPVQTQQPAQPAQPAQTQAQPAATSSATDSVYDEIFTNTNM